MKFGMLSFLIVARALTCFGQAASPAQKQVAPPGQSPTDGSTLSSSGKHTVTVAFDYDFSRTPACSRTVTKACIQQFNVYDISTGEKHRVKLFSIPVTPGETKSVRGITGKSPPLVFEPGKHQLAVTAQGANGRESAVNADTTWVTVPAPEAKP